MAMAKLPVNQPPATSSKLSPSEEEELKALEESEQGPPKAPEMDEAMKAQREREQRAALEAERAALVAAAEVERQKKLAAMPATAPASPQRTVGDVRVLCLKDNPRAVLGGRPYNLKQGQIIEMNPSHAVELEQTGWVLLRG